MNILALRSEMKLPLNAVQIPLHTAAVKTSRGVVLISPIDFDASQIRLINDLGSVVAIVLPSLIHYLHVKKAQVHFPTATVWAPVGAREALPQLHIDKILSVDQWPYEEIDFVTLEGAPKIAETVFLSKPDKTIFVADLVTNMMHAKGWAAPFLLKISGGFQKLATNKRFKVVMKDKDAFKHSLAQILEWNFDKILVAHGEFVGSDGKERLQTALKEGGY